MGREIKYVDGLRLLSQPCCASRPSHHNAKTSTPINKVPTHHAPRLESGSNLSTILKGLLPISEVRRTASCWLGLPSPTSLWFCTQKANTTSTAPLATAQI